MIRCGHMGLFPMCFFQKHSHTPHHTFTQAHTPPAYIYRDRERRKKEEGRRKEKKEKRESKSLEIKIQTIRKPWEAIIELRAW